MADSALPADTRAALHKQLRFYFSDANLRRDRFLQQQLGADGRTFMPVSTLCTFKRVSAVTSDAALVAAVLADVDLVELSEDRAGVRRREAVRPISRDDADARTVYVERLPSSCDQETLEAALTRAVGPVSFVALPRFDWPEERRIKGYAFVEFVHARDAERAPATTVRMCAQPPAQPPRRRPPAPAGAPAADAAGAADAPSPPLVLAKPRELRILPKREWERLKAEYAARVSLQLEASAQERHAELAARGASTPAVGAAGRAADELGEPRSAEASAQAKGTLIHIRGIPEHASRTDVLRWINQAGARALAHASGATAAAPSAAPAADGAGSGAAAPALAKPEFVDFPKPSAPGTAYARFRVESDAHAYAAALCVHGAACLPGTLVVGAGASGGGGGGGGGSSAGGNDGGDDEPTVQARVLSLADAVEYWREVNVERAQRWLLLQRQRQSFTPHELGAGGAPHAQPRNAPGPQRGGRGPELWHRARGRGRGDGFGRARGPEFGARGRGYGRDRGRGDGRSRGRGDSSERGRGRGRAAASSAYHDGRGSGLGEGGGARPGKRSAHAAGAVADEAARPAKHVRFDANVAADHNDAGN